ncbi:MAG: succinate dehydrogenase [Magnetovibrio sp.]|nr:succinate dehydrogenase [Magnetovibrio sp.]
MSAPNIQTEARLWLAQRVSAMVLAVCIAVHLGTIVYAVRGGLSAAEIIGRVAGSEAWFAFYSVFVIAVTVHAPIGLRAILNEMTKLPKTRVDLLCFLAAVLLAYLGLKVAWRFYMLGGA